MIIVCPSCEKKFEVDSKLIPEKGRLLNCSSCDQTWFYNANITTSSKIKLEKSNDDREIHNIEKSNKEKIGGDIGEIPENKKLTNIQGSANKKDSTKSVKIHKSVKFSLSKILSYLIVIIISFIALIIVLETFKTPLNNIFPSLELILFSLFETVKDIFLFLKNLIL